MLTGERLPDGSIRMPDGSIRKAKIGVKLADGSIRFEDGSVRKPDGTIIKPSQAQAAVSDERQARSRVGSSNLEVRQIPYPRTSEASGDDDMEYGFLDLDDRSNN